MIKYMGGYYICIILYWGWCVFWVLKLSCEMMFLLEIYVNMIGMWGFYWKKNNEIILFVLIDVKIISWNFCFYCICLMKLIKFI